MIGNLEEIGFSDMCKPYLGILFGMSLKFTPVLGNLIALAGCSFVPSNCINRLLIGFSVGELYRFSCISGKNYGISRLIHGIVG